MEHEFSNFIKHFTGECAYTTYNGIWPLTSSQKKHSNFLIIVSALWFIEKYWNFFYVLLTNKIWAIFWTLAVNIDGFLFLSVITKLTRCHSDFLFRILWWCGCEGYGLFWLCVCVCVCRGVVLKVIYVVVIHSVGTV